MICYDERWFRSLYQFTFMPKDEVTEDRVMNEAKRVFDSYHEINLRESITLEAF